MNRIICTGTKFLAVLFAFGLLSFLIGESFPSPLDLTRHEQVLVFSLILVWMGLVGSLRWMQWGGMLIIGGVVLFYFSDYFFTHTWPRGPWLLLCLVPGIFSLVCSGKKRK